MDLLRASGKLQSRKVYPPRAGVGGGVDGGFIHTCLGHADALRKNGPYTQMRIGRTSMQEALRRWYLDDEGQADHWHLPCALHEKAPLQCNPTCAAAWAGPADGATTGGSPAADSTSPLHLQGTPPAAATSSGWPHVLLVMLLVGCSVWGRWLCEWRRGARARGVRAWGSLTNAEE